MLTLFPRIERWLKVKVTVLSAAVNMNQQNTHQGVNKQHCSSPQYSQENVLKIGSFRALWGFLSIKISPVPPRHYISGTGSATWTPPDWIMDGESTHRTQGELTLRHQWGRKDWWDDAAGREERGKRESCLQCREEHTSDHGRLLEAALFSLPPAPLLQTHPNK